MGAVEQSVEVAAPLESVYDAWTRFEEFPRFMEGVADVQQRDETHVPWRVRLDGVERELDVEITEQRPCERIAWQAIVGDSHRGSVTFEHLDDGRTRLTLRIEDDAPGRFERAEERSQALQVQDDLERFKAVMERARSARGTT